MKNTLWIMIVFLLATLGACKKDRKEVADNSFASDNSTAENLFNDVYKVVDDVSSQTTGIREDGIGCIDTIIVDTVSVPRTITVDFGTDDCTGHDGKIRKGILFITYTGKYKTAGTIITVTPQNYTINGYSITGTKTITNLGVNGNDQPYFSIVVNGSITAPGGLWTSTWNSTRTRTWVEGYQHTSTTIWDDVYEITGTASGVNRHGNSYSINITTPLRAEVGCAWLVSGVLTIAPTNADVRTVNFGSGACNNGFTVTVNGETESFNGGD